MTPRRGIRSGTSSVLVLCTAFALLALMHNAATPLFEAPDEIWHYAYVRWIAEGHGLPALDDDASGAYQQAAQPPLYYLVAALVSRGFADDELPSLVRHNPGFGYQAAGTSTDNKNMLIHGPEERWPWRGAALAVHATRLTSLVFGLTTVCATYGLAFETTRSHRWALVTAALAAFQPQFVFISSVVSNDSAAAALGTAALWCSVGMLRRGATRSGVLLAGCIAGAAILSKTSLLLVAPLLCAIIAIAPAAVREVTTGARRGARVGELAVYLTTTAAVGGWWYIRNAVRYGTVLGLTRHVATPWGRPEPATLVQIARELPSVARSFWAGYGWGHVAWPQVVYVILWVLTLPLLVVGASVMLRAWARACSRPEQRWALLRPGRCGDAGPISGLICLLWLGATFVALLRWMQQVEAPHGRLLFPALGAWALLTSLGLREVSSAQEGMGGAWRRSLLGLCAGLAILAPGARLAATFAPPRLSAVDRVTARCDRVVDLRYGDQARLLCAGVQPERVEAGGAVSVRACWTALTPMDVDYTVFAHVIGPESSRVGERHTYPGLGRYPTSAWPVGSAFCETYVVHVEDWAPAPLQYRVELGLYDAATGQRLIAQTADQQVSDPPIVSAVSVEPSNVDEMQPAASLAVSFGDGIQLVGFDGPGTATPGDAITITLYWEADSRPTQDYIAFVHLWRPGDPQPLAQHDSPPRLGWYPTLAWRQGDIVRDEHVLQIPETLAPGSYRLWAGLYAADDGVRLAARSEGGRLLNDLVPLGQLDILK